MELERTWTHDDRVAEHRLTRSGPWDDEPDKVQWVDPATDLDCLAVRNHMGNWCGYVGVPPGHRLYGQPADEGDFSVHGGITFYGALCDEDAEEGHGICHVPFPGRPADVWWVGFDCGHAFDLIPSMIDVLETIPMPVSALRGRARQFERRDVYRTLAYVRGECADLAKQVREAA